MYDSVPVVEVGHLDALAERDRVGALRWHAAVDGDLERLAVRGDVAAIAVAGHRHQRVGERLVEADAEDLAVGRLRVLARAWET